MVSQFRTVGGLHDQGRQQVTRVLRVIQKKKYNWKLVSDPSFIVAKERAKLGLGVLDYVPTEEAESEMTVPVDPRPLELPQYRSHLD